jgi:hypothetical protein
MNNAPAPPAMGKPLYLKELSSMILPFAFYSEPQGRIAKWPITIARARHNLSMVKAGKWLNFQVEAMSVFEKADNNTMDRTMAYVQERLVD